MPEAGNMKTTMHGPASRIPMFSRTQPEGDDESSESDEECTPGEDASTGGVQQPACTPADDVGPDKSSAPEALNEHETIIAVDEENLPQTAKLFEALTTNLEMLSVEGAKYAQAHMMEEAAEAAAEKTAAKEFISTSIAVNLQDIAKRLTRDTKAMAEWERLAAVQEETDPMALAVPSGKPLSMFDTTALPATYTEFTFGDCVPQTGDTSHLPANL